MSRLLGVAAAVAAIIVGLVPQVARADPAPCAGPTTGGTVVSGTVASGTVPGSGYAVGSDGIVYAWGDNSDGQLGNGSSGGTVLVPTPALMPAEVTVVEVKLGGTAGTDLSQTGASWSVSAPPGCGPRHRGRSG